MIQPPDYRRFPPLPLPGPAIYGQPTGHPRRSPPTSKPSASLIPTSHQWVVNSADEASNAWWEVQYEKLLALLFVVVMVVAFAAPVGADDGFVLIGADAARVELVRDGCTVEVSYVRAVAVRYFDRPMAKTFEDIDVSLWGDCGGLEGTHVTRNISDGHPDADIEKLEWAYLTNDFEVRDDAGFRAVINLRWTAVGKAYTEVFNEPGMRAAHRTRGAVLDETGSSANDRFCPVDPVTRGQMAAFLYRALG